ncbi:MAG: hypothetical protein HQ564_05745 [Candidatus Saganbacteria bacterium]|nr:hypothetical protein [Candidatus Saganbacteria bacterium]
MSFSAKLKAFILNEYPNCEIDHLFTSVPRGTSKIPNVVYQTWESNKLGKTHFKELKKFRGMNMDYSFEFFDNLRMDNYMSKYYRSHKIHQIYQNAKFGPLKTDIFRYCILFERGGIYFDINKSVNISLRDIIQDNDEAIISFEQNPIREFIDWEAPKKTKKILKHPELIVLNWGLAFTRGHVFLAKIIDNIVNDYKSWKMKRVSNVKSAIVQFTGPLMLTRSIWQVIEDDPGVSFRQMGIDFERHADFNMRGSWSRYAITASYAEFKNNVIVS